LLPLFVDRLHQGSEGAGVTRLSVNLNKVALLRNQRPLGVPSVTRMARIALEAGAHGITVHPRPDARHIRQSDVHELAALLAGERHVELNIEGNPFPDLMDLVRKARPAQCTLVPDSPEQATSDHGWRLVERGQPTDDARRLVPVLAELRALGVRTSLFMDPDPEQIRAVRALGADRIELYTEAYARAFATPREAEVWASYARAARCAQEEGLGVNAGHDLDLANLGRLLEIPGILEVSIGHALTAEALEHGLSATVRAYVAICEAAS
jgi:pyridoxine 5-phosphate synthase